MSLGYGSHVPILANFITYFKKYNSRMSILEIGVGWWSTPIIQLAGGVSFIGETTPLWTEGLALWKELYDDIISETSMLKITWDLVFVDSWPEASRVEYVMKLYPKVKTFILHDSDPEWEHAYKYRELLVDKFPYRLNFDAVKPNTMVLSHRPIPKFLTKML